jgi:pimeloyl-ACP methyl ester carboxylesterase
MIQIPKRVLAMFPILGLLILVGILVIGCSGNPVPKVGSSVQFKEKGVILTAHYTQYLGQNLNFITGGDSSKKAILFVHGSPGSASDYFKYLTDSTLGKMYYLIAVDRPGFGNSIGYDTMPSLKAQAAIIQSVASMLSPKNLPMAVIGHSYGGPLAVRLAIDYPETFDNVVLLAAALDPALEEKEWFRPVFANDFVSWMLPKAIKASNAELMVLKDDLMLMDKEWEKLKAPILMLHGTSDMLVPYKNTAYAQLKKTDSSALKVVSLPKVNHFIPWTHFDLVKEKLIKLL